MSDNVKEVLQKITDQAGKANAKVLKVQAAFEDFLASQSFREYKDSLEESEGDEIDALNDDLWSIASDLGGQINEDYEFWIPSTC